MNLQFYVEKLNSLDDFQEFISNNPDAYLCSGFFVIDKGGKDNKSHLDFFIPGTREMVSFHLEESGKKVSLRSMDGKVPDIISDLTLDFGKIEDLIFKKMKNEKMSNKIQKIIVSVQKSEGKTMAFCTIFTSMFGIIKTGVSVPENTLIGFEKKSLFDIVKIMKK